MGKKRKHEMTEEEIRKKIRKLERKLIKPATRSGVILSSSSPEPPCNAGMDTPSQVVQSPDEDYIYGSPPQGSPRLGSPPQGSPPRGSSPQDLPPPDSPLHNPPPRCATPQPGTSAASEEKEAEAEELQLDDETLELLGDAPKSDNKLGPAIHKDIASRWQDLLAKGLPKETKAKILAEYLVPNNCERLLAPLLNPEAKAALPEPAIKRDSSIMAKQNQLGIALSALAKVTELVVSNETSKQKILKPLSDACRILCDSHHAETKTRRNFVLGSINSSLRETLNETGSEKFLFGENVSEKLKIAKNIQRSGEALKTQTNKNNNSKNYTAKRGRLNYRAPNQRKPPEKTTSEPGRAARAPQRAPPAQPAGNRRRSSPQPARRVYRK